MINAKKLDVHRLDHSQLCGEDLDKASLSEFLFDVFLSKRRVLLYGATDEARLLIETFPDVFHGIIDRQLPQGNKWNGLGSVNAIKEGDIVINCVCAANAWAVEQRIKRSTAYQLHVYKFLKLVDKNHYFDSDRLNPVIRDWSVFPQVFLKNILFFNSLMDSFDDLESKVVFRDYLDSRLSGDIMLLGGGRTLIDPETMYFPEFLPEQRSRVFLDIGGFDGANSLAALRTGNGTNAIICEPEPNNLTLLNNQLAGYQDRCFIEPVMVGDSNTDCYIQSNGPSSMKSEESGFGSVKVQQMTLDDLYEKYDLDRQNVFLKVDVEGGERFVFQKASRFLRSKQKNVLALSVYHRADDFVTLIPLIREFCKNRKMRLRHMTAGFAETVLFVY